MHFNDLHGVLRIESAAASRNWTRRKGAREQNKWFVFSNFWRENALATLPNYVQYNFATSLG